MKKWWILRIIKGIVFVTLAVLLFGFVTMHLWNFVVPALFGGPVIGFTMALALLLLAKILFGGFKGGCWGCRGGCYGRGGWKGKHYWHKRMEEKLSHMTPEEREKFKNDLRNKCGYGWNDAEDAQEVK
jgi:hypothetical protein